MNDTWTYVKDGKAPEFAELTTILVVVYTRFNDIDTEPNLFIVNNIYWDFLCEEYIPVAWMIAPKFPDDLPTYKQVVTGDTT